MFVFFRSFLTSCIFLLLCSCTEERKPLIENITTAGDKVVKKGYDTCVAGKVIKIEKINDRDNYFFLKNEKDSMIKFLTVFSINNTGISF